MILQKGCQRVVVGNNACLSGWLFIFTFRMTKPPAYYYVQVNQPMYPHKWIQFRYVHPHGYLDKVHLIPFPHRNLFHNFNNLLPPTQLIPQNPLKIPNILLRELLSLFCFTAMSPWHTLTSSTPLISLNFLTPAAPIGLWLKSVKTESYSRMTVSFFRLWHCVSRVVALFDILLSYVSSRKMNVTFLMCWRRPGPRPLRTLNTMISSVISPLLSWMR